MEMMVLDDDIIFPNHDEGLSNNILYNKETIFRNTFYPCYKKLESWNSVKSNDIYFHKESSVSNHDINNKPNNFKDIDSIDDDMNFFKRPFQSENNDEEDLISQNDDDELVVEKYNNEPKFNPDNIKTTNFSGIMPLIDDDVAIIREKDGKCDCSLNEIQEVMDIETTINQITKIEKPIEKPKEKIIEMPKKKKQIRGKRGPYRKKQKVIIETETDDECFPFSTGNGLLSEDANDNKLKQYMNIIFRINTYVTESNGNKKKEKKQRKFKPDDIRKKIKVRFHKKIKNIINENLKKAGSTELFSFLPQYFISNISKKFNNQYMNKTYEELLSINFSEFQKEYPNKSCDNNQYIKNKKTLEYLKKNPEISKISGFDIVKKMKYKDIFKAYFASAEFEKSIETLKEEENENAEYIQEYFILAKNYIEYFMNVDDNVY